MSTDLVAALAAVTDRLVALAADDPQLRTHLRQLAHAVIEATDREFESNSVPAETDVAFSVETDASASMDFGGNQVKSGERRTPPAARQSLPELTLGRSVPAVEPSRFSFPSSVGHAADEDFSQIEARCRLKAEGARWAATRRRLISEGATFATEIEPLDRDIIARAKEIPDCYLWMCTPNGPTPSDLRQYEEVAACFEVMADAAAMLKQIQAEPDLHQGLFERSLDLLAEAQSALRVSIAAIDGPKDADQSRVFNWLKSTSTENQIFIQRYMRTDDPADPSQWVDLSSRVETVDSSVQEARRQAKQRRKLLGKVRHKLSLIGSETGNVEDHWRILGSAVDDLVSDGLPPSNRELRELLIPAIDGLPELDELPKGFQLVLREIDRFIATCPPIEHPVVTQPTQEVREVARLLESRSMVLIGGDRRPANQQALKEAFKLRELIWIETREHQSIDGFEPMVARPEVAIVALAIRWSSHAFGDVKDFCDRYGKPLVRLPGGYNPNQVAAQIMNQCSERLEHQ